MKSLNLKSFLIIIYLINFNSIYAQSNQNYNNIQKRFLVDSDEPIIYLKEAFKDKLKIGSFVNFLELDKAEDFIKNHFDIITLSHELLPESILNQKTSIEIGNNTNPQVEFSPVARKLLEFCEKNKIPIHGRTFVWYSQTPNWFFKENFSSNEKYVSKDIMDKRLENFIKNTFTLFEKEFPDLEIYSYDVATEIFSNDGGELRNEQESNWIKIYGDDSFVLKAFTYARKYAPKGCKLLFSDYNEYLPPKTNDIYDLALKLNELGVIDGIGMESHLFDDFPSFDDYKCAFENFVKTGLKVFITELEIQSKNTDNQCSFYRELFLLYLENKEHISSITLFAITDEYKHMRKSDSVLFDYNYMPKKSYYCVIETLDNEN